MVGAGQAGLAARHELAARGIDHLVLERETVAAKWRERWDSFTLVTPNWTVRLPGAEYTGPEPDGFIPRDEIVRHLERYAASTGGDVVTGVEATEVTDAPGGGYRLQTNQGEFEARSLVIATGTFQKSKRPAGIGAPSRDIFELHSSSYRNPDQLPQGGVLIIGSGQTGMQLADELLDAGRRVHISTGKAGRLPRRYRGSDGFRWWERLGLFEQSVETLPSLAARGLSNPYLSGKGGGRTLNLHQMAHRGAAGARPTDGTRRQQRPVRQPTGTTTFAGATTMPRSFALTSTSSSSREPSTPRRRTRPTTTSAPTPSSGWSPWPSTSLPKGFPPSSGRPATRTTSRG